MDNALEFVNSRLGTHEYWDKFYDEELTNFEKNGGEGEIWFGRLCEAKMVEFLIKKASKDAIICDIGTGNGSVLRKLSNCGFLNLFGIDYSYKAIELAKNISSKNYSNNKIKFLLANISEDKLESELKGKFDILLDKGTFDAISLTNKSDLDDEIPRNELINLLENELLCFDCELPTNNNFEFGGCKGNTYIGCVFKWRG
uniref:Methyltransferase domain-containing protein n=1 Tax=Meloidogyne javanica TaxID=6303 RepID=A0A915M1Y5_MELJA